MIYVMNEVEPYEVNGNEANGLRSSKNLLRVESHWNRSEFVVLRYEEKNITVKASDLIVAINNATKTNKF
jgi:hypothetical protein